MSTKEYELTFPIGKAPCYSGEVGISKLEFFTAQAMMGLLAGEGRSINSDLLSVLSIEHARAIIAQLDRVGVK